MVPRGARRRRAASARGAARSGGRRLGTSPLGFDTSGRIGRRIAACSPYAPVDTATSPARISAASRVHARGRGTWRRPRRLGRRRRAAVEAGRSSRHALLSRTGGPAAYDASG
jgi:hypothetical protein